MRSSRRARTGSLRLVLAALCLIGLSACSSTPTAPTAAQNGAVLATSAQEPASVPAAIVPAPANALGAIRFLAFGDSITYGTLSSFDGTFLIHDEVGSYPRLLRTMLDTYNRPAPFSVVNAGVPGETARSGVDRLPQVLTNLNPRPQVVMLLEGINDMNINNATPAQVVSNVAYMVQTARLFNCTVLVATMPQTYHSTYPDGTVRTQSAEKIRPYNDELRRQLSGLQNVHIVDIYAAFGTNRSLMGADGLHPTPAGYQRMAQEFHSVISTVFPVRGSLQ